MALSPLKQTYKLFLIEPLHLKGIGRIAFAVEDLDISQTFSPTYKDSPVYGRMDGIVTYESTKRSLGIKFTCRAHHLTDTGMGVVDNIKRVNLLTQCLYPSYTSGPSAVLKSPPFFRIFYGNYVGGYQGPGDIGVNDGLTGYITGFSHGIGPVATNVAFGGEGAAPNRALPRKIDIGFTFNVVHDKDVGWRDRNGTDFFSYDEPYNPGYGDNFPYNVSKSPIAPVGSLREAVELVFDTTTTTGQKAADTSNSPVSPAKRAAESQSKAVIGLTNKPVGGR